MENASESITSNTFLTKKKKVALGLSGGVDSATCAHLLTEQGYDVTGIYLECWRSPGCRSEEDRKDALKVALDLGIPFRVLDFKKAYHDKVVEYFFNEYEAGNTPNPDVMCNKEIKFGLFYRWAMAERYDYVATGHYAKIIEIPSNLMKTDTRDFTTKSQTNQQVTNFIQQEKQLAVPKDSHKDQTYFLYLLTKDQIDHTIFPLQNFTKKEVRQEAQKRGIHVSNKKDSVGICFIGDINVHNFLRERLGENPGEVVDTAGNIIGSHTGLWFYTIGQRNGFQINAKTIIKMEDGTTIDKHNIPPFYVIRKNAKRNQLIVGFGAETFRDSFEIRDLHWIVESNKNIIKKTDNLFVRIRHTGELIECKVQLGSKNSTVYLKIPSKGIAEGQSAVIYKKIDTTNSTETICLGGGIIC